MLRRTLSAVCISVGTLSAFAMAVTSTRAAQAQRPSPRTRRRRQKSWCSKHRNSRVPGASDPSIGNLPQLKKPPFDAYNTFAWSIARRFP